MFQDIAIGMDVCVGRGVLVGVTESVVGGGSEAGPQLVSNVMIKKISARGFFIISLFCLYISIAFLPP